MKSDQMYHKLKELAEQLCIRVSERNLRDNPGIKARSGLCKIKGEYLFIMDKGLPIQIKIRELAECLRQQPNDHIYVVPAVRELLDSGKI